jgi:citrate synthase
LADTLSIKDNRTGKTYEIPIQDGAIRAMDLRQVKVSDSDFGMMSYDPAYLNTASCKSSITYIDGEKGILRYRGYPIEELAEKCEYLQVAYLLIHGELPNKNQYEEWKHNITFHTMVHENVKKLLEEFRYDAHPMGMLISAIAALSTYYPDAKNIFDENSRSLQIYRLIGKMPTLAAYAYRHSQGMASVYPNNDLEYAENFLTMMYKPPASTSYKANPVLSKALDVLFVLHADHEQNASTSAMRGVGSTHADPYSSAAAATAALYGPLHGGANEEVVRMLEEIGSKDKVPEIIRQVKEKKRLLMGFGHRVYHNYDPRAKIVKKVADEVFAVTGRNRLLDIALELEKVALSDEYFISKHLYPNVDFYSGLIYQAMGFSKDIFPVLFAIPRMSGWLAQWQEMLNDQEQKISRPRQIYTGYPERHLDSFAERQ